MLAHVGLPVEIRAGDRDAHDRLPPIHDRLTLIIAVMHHSRPEIRAVTLGAGPIRFVR